MRVDGFKTAVRNDSVLGLVDVVRGPILVRVPLQHTYHQANLLPTYRLDIEYLGTDWHGWQIQPDRPTVQAAIQDALRVVLKGDCPIVGSGRTDAGVHALGQVAHFSWSGPIEPHRLLASLNGILPASIAIQNVAIAPEGFHARFHARWRRYRYRIGEHPTAFERAIRWQFRPGPDLELMNEAALHLLGRKNFDAFCRTAAETENRMCHVLEAAWSPDLRSGDASFLICADRFLHGMVRAIVGTLVEIGQGKRPPEDIDRILDSGDRREAGYAAPARGLTLEAVGYEEPPSGATG